MGKFFRSIDEWLYLAFRDLNLPKGMAVENFWENIVEVHKQAGIETELDPWVRDTIKFIHWSSGNNEEKVFEFIRLFAEKEVISGNLEKNKT